MAITEMERTLADDLAAVAGALRRSTVQVRGRGPGGGSGVVWREDGLIVTNAHVARGSDAVVEFEDGRVLDANIASRDPGLDLAALQVDARDLPAAEIGDSSALRVGELVVAVGNPLGLTGAFSSGIVHAIAPIGRTGQEWVRADIRLLPGNSGGPLADAQGRVVGINSMVAGGLGLAVPSNVVERFLQHRGRRPQLGIVTQPVLVPYGRSRVAGLLVLEVVPGGPAQAAGVSIGDVVIGVDGQLFRGPRDLSALQPNWGETVSLDLLRGGVHAAARVTIPLPEAPNQEAA